MPRHSYSRITLAYDVVFEDLLFLKHSLDAAFQFTPLLQIARILSIAFVPFFL